MTGAAETPNGLDRARQRVVAERQRASRAAEVATRHELLATTAQEELKQFHQNVATTHRQMEARHLVTAGIQAAHVERLRSWAQATPRGTESSTAASALTGSIADRDIGESFRFRTTHDPLTGLVNRTHFIERLGEALGWLDDLDNPAERELRRVGVCHVDLDDFKAVNDRLGHDIGDHLLVSIANRLTERLPGHLLARLGGDEFAVLLEDTSGADEATKAADAVIAAVGEPFRIDGHEMTITASVGVVERPVEGADPTEVMRAADMTLSWAKRAGGGRWALFDPERDERTKARYALAATLPSAIDRGELFVEYQPIVALRSGAVLAAEALVRWRHPVMGVIYPDRFIGLAEATNVIMRLGAAVLTQACREGARWSALTPNPPTVSVNIAARQLRDADLAAEVASALDQAGLQPSRLQLEITEGAIVRPDDKSVSALRQLVAMGVRLAIDDFGTGYSNMSYLRRLPVQTLKIDRSFVAEVGRPDRENDTTSVQILAAMVSLGHALGLGVTAEGVETSEQVELLRSIGCDSVQGWYFGRPVGADDFAATLAAQDGEH